MKTKILSREPIAFDMTPMVDMVLLLLIFFMLVSTFVPLQVIKLTLPESTRSQQLSHQPETLTITITRDENVYVEEEEVSWKELPKKLEDKLKVSEDKKVYVRADKDTRLQPWVLLMDILHQGGVHDIELATTSEEEER